MELRARYQVLEKVDKFRYLGWMFLFHDNEWPSIVRNLQRARRKWVKFYRMLGQERANTRTFGRFYVVVLQSILIFVSDSWVTTPRIM